MTGRFSHRYGLVPTNQVRRKRDLVKDEREIEEIDYELWEREQEEDS